MRDSEYWDSVAQEFDTFYRKEKDPLRRVMDQVLRKGMTERYNLTLQECMNVEGKKILDVGCGSGRVSVELAKRGGYVTGIDFSVNMIEMAKSLALRFDVEDNCTFLVRDFTDHVFDQGFDIVIALGFFDYVREPSPYLKKMKSLTKEKCIMSFPSKFALQVPVRFIWLKSRNCSVYFYAKNEISRLLSAIFPYFEVRSISASYFSVARAKRCMKAEWEG